MDRAQLLMEARDLLAHTGFFVSEQHWSRGLSFDLAARRDDVLLLVKILLNVDALSQDAARELKAIAYSLDAATLLVGLKSSSGALQQGVVYSRFGIPIATPRTLQEFLEEGVPPFIFSAPGGLYVRLNSDVLRRVREEMGISLGQMAEVAHVSRRTIQMYVDGMSATVEAASRLEEFLNEPLVLPLDPFGSPDEAAGRSRRPSPAKDFHGMIRSLLTKLGYDVFLTQRSPFDAITKDEAILFLAGMDRQERALRRKAEVVANLSKVVEKEPIIFVSRREKISLRGVPIIDALELRKLRERGEMVELVEERKE
ncbi:MAG: transcriptional regulator [Thermoplasmata archaeon]